MFSVSSLLETLAPTLLSYPQPGGQEAAILCSILFTFHPLPSPKAAFRKQSGISHLSKTRTGAVLEAEQEAFVWGRDIHKDNSQANPRRKWVKG